MSLKHAQLNLNSMIDHLDTLPDNPTEDQLARKVKIMIQSLLKDLVTSPERIKSIIREGMALMGWNSVQGIVIDESLFNFSNFRVSLEYIRDNWSNIQPLVLPSPDELEFLSLACNRLWELDEHRLVPEKDYIINVQMGKKIYEQFDAAPEPFFTFVDESVFGLPTYGAFVALLDNYIASVGQSEQVTRQELAEAKKFLELIMETPVMQYIHQYLLIKQKTKATTKKDFIAELNDLWFGLYSRKARNDSSGFEHVFVGEIKEDSREISGFHNWIQLYLEEKKGTFDYRGFIKPKRKGYSRSSQVSLGCEQFVSIQFLWKGALKNVSSSFIGTSPEFEMALYTLCFYCGEQLNSVSIGPYRVDITCHTWPPNPHPGQRVHIATSFPAESQLDENEAATRIQARSRSMLQQKKR